MHGLPRRGGGTHGKTVWFLAEDIDEWTRHLTGLSLADCVREGDRLWQEGEMPTFQLERRSRLNKSLPVLPEWALYVVTEFRPETGKQVRRDQNGWTHAAVEPTVFEEMAAAHDLPTWGCDAWLFQGMRTATEEDLRAATRRPRSTRQQVGCLLGALEPVQGRLRWCDVPGRLLAVPSAGRTRCLVIAGLPCMEELIQWVASTYPRAMWVIWPRRKLVHALALDEVEPDLTDVMRDVLG